MPCSRRMTTLPDQLGPVMRRRAFSFGLGGAALLASAGSGAAAPSAAVQSRVAALLARTTPAEEIAQISGTALPDNASDLETCRRARLGPASGQIAALGHRGLHRFCAAADNASVFQIHALAFRRRLRDRAFAPGAAA